LLQTAVEYFRSLAPRWQDRFRFLQISTDEVYGSLGETGSFSEKSQYQPNSPYAASKAAADHFVHAFWKTYGLPTLIANPSNNYGPFQFPEKLIPLMILNAIEGKSLPIYGDGNNIRDWVYVEDTCRAVEMILEKGQPGETYNIGGNFERSNRQVVEAICYLVDELCPDLPHRPCSSLIDFVEDRPGHDRRYAIDAGKIRDEIGWQPFVTFEKGLAQTVNWYVNQWDWIEQIAAGGSQRDRLGLTPKKNQHAPS
jgi:dTDP-glucose 4,6-dehydratase